MLHRDGLSSVPLSHSEMPLQGTAHTLAWAVISKNFPKGLWRKVNVEVDYNSVKNNIVE